MCDVCAFPPDLASVDVLARLQVTAKRRGCSIHVRGASPELRALLQFCGLADTLALDVLGVEPGRQAPQREQRLGLEEELEVDDPPIRDLEDL